MVHVLSADSTAANALNAAWSDLASEEVYPGIIRQTVNGACQTMVRYHYAPGSVFPVHSHPEEQVTIVVSGAIAFTVASQEFVLTAGHVVVIPAGIEHGARVLGAESVETFNALSPRRLQAPGPEEGNVISE